MGSMGCDRPDELAQSGKQAAGSRIKLCSEEGRAAHETPTGEGGGRLNSGEPQRARPMDSGGDDKNNETTTTTTTTEQRQSDPSPAIVVASSHGEETIGGELQKWPNARAANKLEQQPERAGQEKQVGPKQEPLSAQGPIRPTGKRYLILAMFIVLHMIKSFQWICLAGITNVVAAFYQVDNLAINWTTIMFMVTFLALALPVGWLMEAIGLRRSVLIGSIGVTIGVTIKCFSCTRDGFNLSMAGHLIIGLSEPFFFSSYSQLASIWFPDHQVAMATAASLIGEEAGLALGFIVPPLMVGNDGEDFAAIQEGLARLFLIVAIICMVNTCSMVLLFDEGPQFAPGIARHRQLRDEQIRRQKMACLASAETGAVLGGPDSKSSGAGPALAGRRAWARRLAKHMEESFGQQRRMSGKLLRNKHFLLLLAGFGMNVGIAYSLHTLLNQMIVRPGAVASPDEPAGAGPPEELTNYSRAHDELAPTATIERQLRSSTSQLTRWQPDEANLIVGNAGLILIIAGLVGSGLCGFVLDRHHKYKLTTASVYLATLISMAALTACLPLENELALYLAIIPLGFALTGYASCAFDYGVEITYPKPELLSSTLLNISAQLFGIPISLIGSLIVDTYGNQALGLFFCAILLAGFIVTLLQGGRLERQEAIREGLVQQER